MLVVCVPSFAHAAIASALAAAGAKDLPVVLNPGHTGGALEFRQASQMAGADPPIAEFSTLSYVARKYSPQLIGTRGSGGLLDESEGAWALAAGEDTDHAEVHLQPDIGRYYRM